MKGLVLKIATLVLFFSLIVGFVAYKAGLFAKLTSNQTRPSLREPTPQNFKKNLENQQEGTLISSSKYKVLVDEERSEISNSNNSFYETHQKSSAYWMEQESDIMMSSSKSFIITEPVGQIKSRELLIEMDSADRIKFFEKKLQTTKQYKPYLEFNKNQ